MSLAQRVHFAVPVHVSWRGHYVNVACGAYIEWPLAARTAERDQVSCTRCQRSHAFREVTA